MFKNDCKWMKMDGNRWNWIEIAKKQQKRLKKGKTAKNYCTTGKELSMAKWHNINLG